MQREDCIETVSAGLVRTPEHTRQWPSLGKYQPGNLVTTTPARALVHLPHPSVDPWLGYDDYIHCGHPRNFFSPNFAPRACTRTRTCTCICIAGTAWYCPPTSRVATPYHLQIYASRNSITLTITLTITSTQAVAVVDLAIPYRSRRTYYQCAETPLPPSEEPVRMRLRPRLLSSHDLFASAAIEPKI